MTKDENPPIDRETFRRMVETYGADQRRWPADKRDPAILFATTEEGRQWMKAAGRLDAALLRNETAPPSAELAGRILAVGGARMSMRRRVRRWVISAGLLGVGLAGGLTGAVVVTAVMPPPTLTLNRTVTAFGELQTDGDVFQEQP